MSSPFVESGDPRQCEGSVPGGGQCRYPSEPGDKLCRYCGGKDRTKIEQKRQYQLTDTRAQLRLAELAEHDSIKTLREEIALARILAEKKFNLIKDDASLILHAPSVNAMLLTIEKLVKTCHTMEQSLGILISRTDMLKIAENVIAIISDELAGVVGFEMVVERVAQRLINAVDTSKVIEVEAKRL